MGNLRIVDIAGLVVMAVFLVLLTLAPLFYTAFNARLQETNQKLESVSAGLDELEKRTSQKLESVSAGLDELEKRTSGEGFYSSSLNIKGGADTLAKMRESFSAKLRVKIRITLTEDPTMFFDYEAPAAGARFGRYIVVREEFVDLDALLPYDLLFEINTGAVIAELKIYYNDYELAAKMTKQGWVFFQLPEEAEIPETNIKIGDPDKLRVFDDLIALGSLVLVEDNSITPVESLTNIASWQVPASVKFPSGVFLLGYAVLAVPGSPIFALDEENKKPYLVGLTRGPYLAVKITEIFNLVQEELGIDLRKEIGG